MIGRDADEWIGRGIAQRRPIDIEDGLQRESEQVGASDGADSGDEHSRTTEERRHQSGDDDPDEPERADARQADEDPVEPADAVEDDEALDVSVERDHAAPEPPTDRPVGSDGRAVPRAS